MSIKYVFPFWFVFTGIWDHHLEIWSSFHWHMAGWVVIPILLGRCVPFCRHGGDLLPGGRKLPKQSVGRVVLRALLIPQEEDVVVMFKSPFFSFSLLTYSPSCTRKGLARPIHRG